jgi:hypothetical protein
VAEQAAAATHANATKAFSELPAWRDIMRFSRSDQELDHDARDWGDGDTAGTSATGT